jgi:hypothetical protein
MRKRQIGATKEINKTKKNKTKGVWRKRVKSCQVDLYLLWVIIEPNRISHTQPEKKESIIIKSEQEKKEKKGGKKKKKRSNEWRFFVCSSSVNEK